MSIGLVYRKEANENYAEIKGTMDKLITKLLEKLDKKYCGGSDETAG